MELHVEFVIVPDMEDGKQKGYFAYLRDPYDWMMYYGGYGALGETKGPYPTRGAGDTPSEAIACLCAVLNVEGAIDGFPEEKQWGTREAQKAFVGVDVK